MVISLTVSSNDQQMSLELGLLMFCVEDQISFYIIFSDLQQTHKLIDRIINANFKPLTSPGFLRAPELESFREESHHCTEWNSALRAQTPMH